jgi:hypothetical protein
MPFYIGEKTTLTVENYLMGGNLTLETLLGDPMKKEMQILCNFNGPSDSIGNLKWNYFFALKVILKKGELPVFVRFVTFCYHACLIKFKIINSKLKYSKKLIVIFLCTETICSNFSETCCEKLIRGSYYPVPLRPLSPPERLRKTNRRHLSETFVREAGKECQKSLWNSIWEGINWLFNEYFFDD